MRIALLGSTGKIGSYLAQSSMFIPVRERLEHENYLYREIGSMRPDFILNLAAYSNVDLCEQYPDEARKVNMWGADVVARIGILLKIPVIYVSTDHIFSGKRFPLFTSYKENSKFNAVNEYGFSKYGGEVATLSASEHNKVIRTSTIFSSPIDCRYVKDGITDVPDYLHRSFLYVHHFMVLLHQYLSNYWSMPEVLHLAGSKTVSWYKFVKDARSFMGINTPTYKKVSYQTAQPYQAERPKRAGLNTKLARSLGLYCPDYLEGFIAWNRQSQ